MKLNLRKTLLFNKSFVLLLAVLVILVVVTGSWQNNEPKDQPEILSGVDRYILVDHTSVSLFEQIPLEYLEAARNLRMFWIDRSVGANLSDGLDCLAKTSYAAAPNSCKRNVTQAEYAPDPVKYNRSNWTYNSWPNLGMPNPVSCPSGAGNWSQKGFCFKEWAEGLVNGVPRINNYDVVSYQFSYLTFQDFPQYDVASPTVGFFVPQANKFDVADLDAFSAQYSNQTVVYWTSSLAKSVGTARSESFNNQMRAHAAANNKVLFDFADIESHDPTGNPCYDIVSGDGGDYAAICPQYTSEATGGHLGSMSTGKIRVAKAYWVLMAQIAGWNPTGEPLPTPLTSPIVRPSASPDGGGTQGPSPTPVATPNPTPVATPVPTASPSSGTLTLSATPSCSTVSLSWNAVTNATGYFLDRCTGAQSQCAGNWSQLALNTQNLFYSNTNLTNNQLYTYRVRARRTDGTFTSFTYAATTPSCN